MADPTTLGRETRTRRSPVERRETRPRRQGDWNSSSEDLFALAAHVRHFDVVVATEAVAVAVAADASRRIAD
jgi:hypothetical protein